MAEQTTPAAPGVVQAPPVDPLVGIRAWIDRADKPNSEEPETPEAGPRADAAAQPEVQTETGELTPEDIPDESNPPEGTPSVDAFEIVHDGQQHKLSREETIRYAQQGFDYTQKTQAVAEMNRQVQERLQRVQAIEQVVPQLEQARAQVIAFEAQLQPYQRVDWVALATQDPLEYSKVRAQYDVLVNTYQGAAGRFQQMRAAVGEQQTAIQQQILHAESRKLTERIPAWTDPEAFKKGSQELRAYLGSEGASPEEIDGLTSSMAVGIAYKAMQYDKLLKAKAGKVKELRTAPPVTRPGAAQPSGSAQADRQQALRQRAHKSGDIRDGAAYLATLLK